VSAEGAKVSPFQPLRARPWRGMGTIPPSPPAPLPLRRARGSRRRGWFLGADSGLRLELPPARVVAGRPGGGAEEVRLDGGRGEGVVDGDRADGEGSPSAG
jgi:hypothetical protein